MKSRILTCKQDRLSIAQRARLDQVLATDAELATTWAAKELLLQLLATTNAADFDADWARLPPAVSLSALPEPAA